MGVVRVDVEAAGRCCAASRRRSVTPPAFSSLHPRLFPRSWRSALTRRLRSLASDDIAFTRNATGPRSLRLRRLRSGGALPLRTRQRVRPAFSHGSLACPGAPLHHACSALTAHSGHDLALPSRPSPSAQPPAVRLTSFLHQLPCIVFPFPFSP